VPAYEVVACRVPAPSLDLEAWFLQQLGGGMPGARPGRWVETVSGRNQARGPVSVMNVRGGRFLAVNRLCDTWSGPNIESRGNDAPGQGRPPSAERAEREREGRAYWDG
jgi:hypothetical protein